MDSISLFDRSPYVGIVNRSGDLRRNSSPGTGPCGPVVTPYKHSPNTVSSMDRILRGVEVKVHGSWGRGDPVYPCPSVLVVFPGSVCLPKGVFRRNRDSGLKKEVPLCLRRIRSLWGRWKKFVMTVLGHLRGHRCPFGSFGLLSGFETFNLTITLVSDVFIRSWTHDLDLSHWRTIFSKFILDRRGFFCLFYRLYVKFLWPMWFLIL